MAGSPGPVAVLPCSFPDPSLSPDPCRGVKTGHLTLVKLSAKSEHRW